MMIAAAISAMYPLALSFFTTSRISAAMNGTAIMKSISFMSLTDMCLSLAIFKTKSKYHSDIYEI